MHIHTYVRIVCTYVHVHEYSPRPEYTYIRIHVRTYLLVPRSAGWSQAGMHLASGGGGAAAGPRQGTL